MYGSGAVSCSCSLLIRGPNLARCQAEAPLIALCRFSKPALLAVILNSQNETPEINSAGIRIDPVSATSRDVGTFDFWGVFDQFASGSPQSGCENCQGDSGKGGQRAVIDLYKFKAASHADLSVSPDPFEREGTFLVLLVSGILIVAGLAYLKC